MDTSWKKTTIISNMKTTSSDGKGWESFNKAFEHAGKAFEEAGKAFEETHKDHISVTQQDGSIIISGEAKNVILNGKIIWGATEK